MADATSNPRDPLGLTPLYVHTPTRRAAHSLGELLPISSRRPNRDALLEHVAFGDVWDEEATLFAEVRRLRSTWTPPKPTIVDRTPRELIRSFWRLLGDAAERAVGGATEVVVTLSGGLDSAALAAALVERLGPSRVRAVTGSAGDDDETLSARLTASALGIEQTVIGPAPMLADWPSSPYWPVRPRTAFDVRWGEATETRGVVVWGVGGDSLQRGDRQHYRERLRRGEVLAGISDVVRTVVLHGRKPALGVRRWLAGPSSPQPVPSHIAVSARPRAEQIARRRAAQASSSRRGVDEMLAPIWRRFFEWMSPHHNDPPIRHVFPFFDTELISFMATVPTAPWCVEKELLRAALRGRIPDEVRLRSKSLVSQPTMIELDSAWAARLREAARAGDGELFDVDLVAATLSPGAHELGAITPHLRCAATQRWLAGTADASTASASNVV